MAVGDFGSVIDTEQLNDYHPNYLSIIKHHTTDNLYIAGMRKNSPPRQRNYGYSSG